MQVSCLIAFIIDMTVGYIGSGFTSFATVNGFIQAVIWFVLKLLHAFPQILANYYIVSCCLLLIQFYSSFTFTYLFATVQNGLILLNVTVQKMWNIHFSGKFTLNQCYLNCSFDLNCCFSLVLTVYHSFTIVLKLCNHCIEIALHFVLLIHIWIDGLLLL